MKRDFIENSFECESCGKQMHSTPVSSKKGPILCKECSFYSK